MLSGPPGDPTGGPVLAGQQEESTTATLCVPYAVVYIPPPRGVGVYAQGTRTPGEGTRWSLRRDHQEDV